MSNEKKIQKYLQKIQAKSTIISVNEWPIPNKMYKHTLLLKKLKNLKKISYENKFNLIIANTKIIYTKLS